MEQLLNQELYTNRDANLYVGHPLARMTACSFLFCIFRVGVDEHRFRRSTPLLRWELQMSLFVSGELRRWGRFKSLRYSSETLGIKRTAKLAWTHVKICPLYAIARMISARFVAVFRTSSVTGASTTLQIVQYCWTSAWHAFFEFLQPAWLSSSNRAVRLSRAKLGYWLSRTGHIVIRAIPQMYMVGFQAHTATWDVDPSKRWE